MRMKMEMKEKENESKKGCEAIYIPFTGPACI